jgi:hypothetical protein
MPYNVSKEVLREVQEMRKSFTIRAYVWRRVFFAQEKQKKKLGTNAKDGGATAERGSAIRWFHHSFILPC